MDQTKLSKNKPPGGGVAAISSTAWRWVFILELLAIAGICAGVLVTDLNRIRHRTTGDFEHFYYAADAVRHGSDPYTAWTRGYIYPPLIAFFFQPLSYLGRDRAAAVMLGVNVTVTLLAVALAADEFLRRFNAPRNRITIAATMLLAMLLNIDKIKGEWQMWQTDTFMLLLFVLSLRLQASLPFAAGTLLGIAINIKYLPLMFIPYLLIRRQWKLSFGLTIGTIGFALLPALSTGWSNNCRNWVTATNGLLQMADVRTKATEAAEVHDVKDSLSCSITSALARGFGPGHGFALAGLTALAVIGIAGWMYRRRNLSIFRSQQPGVIGAEWVMLVAAVLAFGPQTNTRHLFDMLIFTTAASVLLLFPRPGVNRIPLLIGTAILFLGFILPPGSRTVIGERTPTVLWLRMGGPCWCLLIAAMTLLWTGLEENAER